jgi:hypothetical protein
VTATASLIAAFFLRPKDKGDGDKKNIIKLKNSDGNSIIQGNSGSINMNHKKKEDGN